MYIARVSGKIDSNALSSKREDESAVVCKRWHNEFSFHYVYSSLRCHLNAKYVAVSTSTGANKNVRVQKASRVANQIHVFFNLALSHRAWRHISCYTRDTVRDKFFLNFFHSCSIAN